jgi:hypothetical protein
MQVCTIRISGTKAWLMSSKLALWPKATESS